MQEYLINFILLAVGFIVLIKASDLFVDNISKFAKSIGVSEFIIGLTLVAFGTSMPELISSIIASARGTPELVVGNLIGSNIANIGLILGVSGIISVIKIEDRIMKRDGYFMLASAIIFFIFTVTKELSRTEALVLILMYIAYLIFLFKEKTIFETDFFEDYLHFFINFEFLKVLKNKNLNHEGKKRRFAFKELLISAISLAFVIFSANLIVDESLWLAGILHFSVGFIGLTLVALGTSLPELSISITAAKKKQGDIALGNILGSNIVNILFILGIAGLITPIKFTNFTLFFAAPFLLFFSSLLLAFIAKKNRLRKWQSAFLLSLYIIFIITSLAYQLVNNIN